MDLFEQKTIAPMLIGESGTAFDSPDYLFELKFDGVRCLAYLDKNETELRNKRNKRVGMIYPELSGLHKLVKKRCILDGEVFILNGGKTDFYKMQRRSLMTNAFKIELAAKKLPVNFVVFDILYMDGKDVTSFPLTKRKVLLQDTVKESERLAISRCVEEKGSALYKAAKAQGMEGIVAKRKTSLYTIGKRTKDWIKCKNMIDDDFIVCGYFFKDELASIILGLYTGGEVTYQGHVVMGMNREDFRRINSLNAIGKDKYYKGFPDFDGAVYYAPELVCKVEYMERTPAGGLRQPVFRGLRDDKTPQECTGKEKEK